MTNNNKISYQRAIELLNECINFIYMTHFDLEDLRDCGFSDNELKELGYRFLLEEDNDE